MERSKQRLAVIVLGKRNAGKSNTWYEIFGKTIRSGWKRLSLGRMQPELYVKNSSHEEAGTEIEDDVFVRNASFEEYGDEVEDYFVDGLPKIVFCSVQYVEKGKRTIKWFEDNGYYLYIQWLNPGYHYGAEYEDYLAFEDEFRQSGVFRIHTGKEKSTRANEIKEFVYNWLSKTAPYASIK